MWFTTHGSNRVSNLENGQAIVIQEEKDHVGRSTWKIVSTSLQAPMPHVLGEGYTSEENARKALDKLLSDLDISPVTIETPEDQEPKEENETKSDKKENK